MPIIYENRIIKNFLKKIKKISKKGLTTPLWFAIIGNVPSEQKIRESGGIGRRARLRGVW